MTSTINRHFVLAAGGTGGHLTPAFALAQELHQRGHQIALITDERGAAIPGKPDFLEAHVLPAGRFGKNPLGWLKGARAVAQGRRMAMDLYKSFAPSAVIGFGGYPALPALLGARGAKVPSVVHEQNAVLGRVNRLLAGGVDAIATSYPAVQRLKPKYDRKVHLVGNPIRQEVLSLRDEPFPSFSEHGLLRVLVTGGSQGARVMSETVPQGLALLPEHLRSRLQVTQQCRPEDLATVRETYASNSIPAELGTYFENMQARLADAHLFIGRAGASTIAELTAVGRPAILVPLPIATDDHQAANTAEMVQAGGAYAIRQHNFTAAELAKQIEGMVNDPDRLAKAAHAAWNCGRPNAARDLADLVEGFGGAPIQDVIRVARNAPKVAAGAVAAKPLSAASSSAQSAAPKPAQTTTDASAPSGENA